MYPNTTQIGLNTQNQPHSTKAFTLKEAAKKQVKAQAEHVKAQAEQIYQTL